MKIKIDLDIKIPSIPAILNVEGRNDIHIPITEISEEDLRKIGMIWIEQLIVKSKERINGD